MFDARFWLASKVQLQTLEDAKIHGHELNYVSFGARTGATCSLSPNGFARLAHQFGVKQLRFSQFARDQPFFTHEGIRFVCVCSEDMARRLSEEFEMVCVDAHLQEAGF